MHRTRPHVHRALIHTATRTKLTSCTHALAPPWHRPVQRGGTILSNLHPASALACVCPAGQSAAAPASAAHPSAVTLAILTATAAPAVLITITLAALTPTTAALVVTTLAAIALSATALGTAATTRAALPAATLAAALSLAARTLTALTDTTSAAAVAVTAIPTSTTHAAVTATVAATLVINIALLFDFCFARGATARLGLGVDCTGVDFRTTSVRGESV